MILCEHNINEESEIKYNGVVELLLDVKGTSREVGVNLKQGYNGDLTSKQAGSVGGQMVKKMNTVRIIKFERKNRIVEGHLQSVRYLAGICT